MAHHQFQQQTAATNLQPTRAVYYVAYPYAPEPSNIQWPTALSLRVPNSYLQAPDPSHMHHLLPPPIDEPAEVDATATSPAGVRLRSHEHEPRTALADLLQLPSALDVADTAPRSRNDTDVDIHQSQAAFSHAYRTNHARTYPHVHRGATPLGLIIRGQQPGDDDIYVSAPSSCTNATEESLLSIWDMLSVDSD